jgi:hypothetical protein
MLGRREDSQVQFLYAIDLDKVVPADHLVRQIDAVLDLSWVHRELRPYYSHTGRPSIDPVLMIRMLLVGYVFALRSEGVYTCSGGAELTSTGNIDQGHMTPSSSPAGNWPSVLASASRILWFRAFADHSFLTCRPLRVHGRAKGMGLSISHTIFSRHDSARSARHVFGLPGWVHRSDDPNLPYDT